MAAQPVPALPEGVPGLDAQFAEIVEVILGQERVARRWGWLNGGLGRHICSPPEKLSIGWGTQIVNGLPVWRCPGCGQAWTQTLSGPWHTTDLS
jgi:hypothetical protein